MKTEKIDESAYDLFSSNGRKMGQLLREVDGFWVFYPEQRGGFWTQEMLGAIAGKLSSMNSSWSSEINEYFNAQAK